MGFQHDNRDNSLHDKGPFFTIFLFIRTSDSLHFTNPRGMQDVVQFQESTRKSGGQAEYPAGVQLVKS